jgi:hypothetical protein
VVLACLADDGVVDLVALTELVAAVLGTGGGSFFAVVCGGVAFGATLGAVAAGLVCCAPACVVVVAGLAGGTAGTGGGVAFAAPAVSARFPVFS